MKCEKVLLFGGSFDPPHAGHMALLQNAIAAVLPDLVVVMPSGTAPHKQASTTPWAVRAEMCRCFLPVFANLVISDMEERRGGKSYTLDTVRQLKEENPGAAVYLMVGSDMLESFTTWHRWRELLAEVTLVAAPRWNGEVCEVRSAAQVLQAQGAVVLFATGPVVEVSSSEIRGAVAQGEPGALALVPPPAGDIIKAKGLYRP